MADAAARPPSRRALLLAWLLLPLFATGYQLCAKRLALASAHSPGWSGWFATVLASPWLALLVVSELAGFLLWIYVLTRMTLSQAFPLSAISYVFVIAMSGWLFGEASGPLQLAGGAIILCGVVLLGWQPRPALPAPAATDTR